MPIPKRCPGPYPEAAILLLFVMTTAVFGESRLLAQDPTDREAASEPVGVQPIIAPTQTYTNPVIADGADPTVLLHNGIYYLYATRYGRRFDVRTSTDLVHWQTGPTVFAPGLPALCAPDIFHCSRDGKFYLYYNTGDSIGVAVADKPDGSFGDIGIVQGRAIDPHLYEDDDGQYYLYFPDGSRMFVLPMTAPSVRNGDRQEILVPDAPWEKRPRTINEGPWMVKHNGTYYLLYSGGGFDTVHYAVGYATANGPLGPFTKYSGNPIIHGSDTIFGPGHGCVVRDSSGNLWHVYHQKTGSKVSAARCICIDPIGFDAGGVLHGKATCGTPESAPMCFDHERP